MLVKIQQLGNSFGIILPKQILGALGLEKGNQIELKVKGQQIELVLSKQEK